MADSKLYVICDILLFMRSHEARPSSVPQKLELWGTVPSCPPMIYATVRNVLCRI